MLMLTAIKIQRKREKRAARRRFLNVKQKQFWREWGASAGETIYRIWRATGHKWIVGKLKIPRGCR